MCGSNQTVLQVDLQTDVYPTETSWNVVDITKSTVAVLSKNDYSDGSTLHSDHYCLNRSNCYQFTINDSYGDGICCGVGDGNYTVFYDDGIIAEGGEFGSSETSIRFGDGCPTQSPSVSALPTTTPSLSSSPTSTVSPTVSLSAFPSSSPSSSPSSTPTTIPSVLPTFSVSPTFSPTASTVPSSSPTEIQDLITEDNNNRRYFPKRPIRTEGGFSYQPIPNCTSPTSDNRVGCVAVPSTYIEDPPHWAGKIYSKQTTCSTNANRRRRCELDVPKSIKATSQALQVNEDDIGYRDRSFLSGDKKRTEAIAAADFNGDGKIDLVIGNGGGQANQLQMNTGNGTFQIPIDLPGEIIYTISIVAVDVNGDGYIDLIIGNYNDVNQLVLNNGGNDTNPFLDAEVFDLPGGNGYTYSIAAVDIDDDGDIDVIIGTASGANQLLLNNGGGAGNPFDGVDALDLPGGDKLTQSVAAADIDNDGDIDLVIGNYGSPNQLLLNNGGDGNPFERVDVLDLPGGQLDTRYIALADVNADGHIDLIIGNLDQAVQLLLNSAGREDNLFTEVDTFDLPSGDRKTISIVAADVDGDGDVDIIIGNDDGQPNQLLLNSGGDRNPFKGAIALDPPGGGRRTVSVVAADVDSDGDLDLIIGNWGDENELLINNGGDLNLLEGLIALDLAIDKRSTTCIAAADFDGDGNIDIVIGNRYGATNQLILNKGGEGVEVTYDLPGVISDTRAIVAADVNGDGDIDVIIGNDGGTNTLLLNNGRGGGKNPFDDAVTFDLPGSERSTRYLKKRRTKSLAKDVGGRYIVAADLNGDGNVDIIIGTGDINQLLLNNGGDNNPFEGVIPMALPGDESDAKFIVAADVDNDGDVDIIIGNRMSANQLLLNNGGDGNPFDGVDVLVLPGGYDSETTSIVTADINGDGRIDLVVGRHGVNVLILNNHDGLHANPFFGADVLELPGGFRDTNSIVATDYDGDGAIDLIIANDEANQLLINNGGGAGDGNPFGDEDVLNLPGDPGITSSIVAADVNGDGYIDLVIGNRDGRKNQLIIRSACPNCGAQLHSKSWCFRCPDFMGRVQTSAFVTSELSACKECLPDYMQQPGSGDKCAAIPCSLGERKFGEEECSDRCPVGTFYDNILSRTESDPSSWIDDRCVDCLPGQYANLDIPAINECFKCLPGEFQPNSTSSDCELCEAGFFQTDSGSVRCEPCSRGGYCDSQYSCNGGFQPCKPGTYNELEGQKDESACVKCPDGTFSIKIGATNKTECEQCPPGAFNNETGQSQCQPCGLGTYQRDRGQTSCVSCDAGTYADRENLAECIPCPYRVNNTIGSVSCPFCGDGFYLNNLSANESAIFQTPDKYCKSCPPATKCSSNTALQTVHIQPEYWRDSLHTSKLYRCDNKVCKGFNNTFNSRSMVLENLSKASDTEFLANLYCEEGHTGPLCEVCENSEKSYFSQIHGECKECPSLGRSILQASWILLSIIAFLALARVASNCTPIEMNTTFSNLSLQAKSKIIISFYQIISSLQVVYGVKLDSKLKGWFDIFNFISLDVFDFVALPSSCVGSMRMQLIASTIWPYMLIVLGATGLVISTFIVDRVQGLLHEGGSEVYPSRKMKIKKKIIFFTIVVFYFALPTVSRSAFSAIKCRSFQTNDNTPDPGYRSYLVADMNIQCNDDDEEYSRLKSLFWLFFALWPVLTPILFTVLLIHIRPSVRRNNPTPLAIACRFFLGRL